MLDSFNFDKAVDLLYDYHFHLTHGKIKTKRLKKDQKFKIPNFTKSQNNEADIWLKRSEANWWKKDLINRFGLLKISQDCQRTFKTIKEQEFQYV